jgi:hypothetical protein
LRQLDLQRTIHRFGERVIVTDTGPADGLPYPELLQGPANSADV